MKNKTIEDRLGPDNAEARKLMRVLLNVVDTTQHSKLDPEDFDGGEFSNTGVGEDPVSKYSFANVEVDGKEYFVQVRDRKFQSSHVLNGKRAPEHALAKRNY